MLVWRGRAQRCPTDLGAAVRRRGGEHWLRSTVAGASGCCGAGRGDGAQGAVHGGLGLHRAAVPTRKLRDRGSTRREPRRLFRVDADGGGSLGSECVRRSRSRSVWTLHRGDDDPPRLVRLAGPACAPRCVPRDGILGVRIRRVGAPKRRCPELDARYGIADADAEYTRWVDETRRPYRGAFLPRHPPGDCSIRGPKNSVLAPAGSASRRAPVPPSRASVGRPASGEPRVGCPPRHPRAVRPRGVARVGRRLA